MSTTQKGLKKREKMLIFTLAMVVLVYLATQFVIYPLFTRLSNDIYKRDHLTIEMHALASDIANKSVLQEAHQLALERHEQALQEFPLLIPNEEIDPILTNLSLHNGLRPTALRFTGSVGTAPRPVQGAESGDDTQTENPYVFTIVSVTMSMTGSYDSLVSLLDDVDTREYIRITNLSFTASRDEASPDDGRITLEFELTFLNA